MLNTPLSALAILPYEPAFAKTFKEINEQWISEMFYLEPKDEAVLNNPQREIIDPGGHILFVKLEGRGIVGTGALLKTGEHSYELTKMGVLREARGHHAGDFLLKALIEKAMSIHAEKLYLLTNSACQAAIHLYEKHGFVHDPDIMAEFGKEYARGNVAMRYRSTALLIP